MSGKAKIEKLTNTWYGLTLFSGLLTVLINGFGIFTILMAGFSVAFGFFLTFVIGRALLNKSHLTRFAMLVLSALFGVFGVLAAFKMAGAFFGAWSLGLLLQAFATGLGAYMNFKSFAVLRDPQVRAYFG